MNIIFETKSYYTREESATIGQLIALAQDKILAPLYIDYRAKMLKVVSIDAYYTTVTDDDIINYLFQTTVEQVEVTNWKVYLQPYADRSSDVLDLLDNMQSELQSNKDLMRFIKLQTGLDNPSRKNINDTLARIYLEELN